jgi:hypothetical protein
MLRKYQNAANTKNSKKEDSDEEIVVDIKYIINEKPNNSIVREFFKQQIEDINNLGLSDEDID